MYLHLLLHCSCQTAFLIQHACRCDASSDPYWGWCGNYQIVLYFWGCPYHPVMARAHNRLSTVLIIFKFTIVLKPMPPYKYPGPGDHLSTIYHLQYLAIFPLTDNILCKCTAQDGPLSLFRNVRTLWYSLTPITNVTATENCHQVYMSKQNPAYLP
jgi:hypothetical protein